MYSAAAGGGNRDTTFKRRGCPRPMRWLYRPRTTFRWCGVHIGKQTIQIVNEAMAETNGKFHFPARALGGVSDRTVDPHSLTTFMRRLRTRLRIRAITVHGLRRTGGTMLTEDERFDGEGIDEAVRVWSATTDLQPRPRT